MNTQCIPAWLISVIIGGIFTIVSALISAFVAGKISHKTLRTQERHIIDTKIDRLVELGMRYPLMEDDEFCSSWLRENRSEDGMRYDNYCCFVFNLLESLWRFHKGCPAKIQEMFDAEDMIKRHKN